MLVPKLRFSEFTDEWTRKKLADIASTINYGMNAASKSFDGINKYIRITDIDEHSNLYSYSDVVSPDSELDKKFLVKVNDILFARTGASTGKTYIYNESDGILYYAGFLIKASIDKKYNSKFIFLQTLTNKYRNWVKLTSMRSGQPGINSVEYGNYLFSITNIFEQIKIAEFISLLDKKIQLQQAKIDALKLYKKGLAEELLTMRIRFPKFNNSWTNSELSKILLKHNKRNKNNEIQNVESISNKYGFIAQDEQFESRIVASEDKSNYYVIEKDTFAYNPSRLNIGSLALKQDESISVVSPLYECFKTTENNKFMLEWFNSETFKKEISSRLEGGVRNTLNFNNLITIPIILPGLKEQNAIAKCLYSFNYKINEEFKVLNSLINFKKSLMQNMFV